LLLLLLLLSTGVLLHQVSCRSVHLTLHSYSSSLLLLVSLQVSFPIKSAGAAAAGAAIKGSHLVAWTTTPWTLPSNLALCVHPELTYVQVWQKSAAHLTVADSGVFCCNIL
jgi:hypothetical protein